MRVATVMVSLTKAANMVCSVILSSASVQLSSCWFSAICPLRIMIVIKTLSWWTLFVGLVNLNIEKYSLTTGDIQKCVWKLESLIAWLSSSQNCVSPKGISPSHWERLWSQNMILYLPNHITCCFSKNQDAETWEELMLDWHAQFRQHRLSFNFIVR